MANQPPHPGKRRLTLDTLGDLHDGAARAAINSAINRAISDIDDRGMDGLHRKVKISLDLQQHENGLVITLIEASAELPKYRTAATFSKISMAGGELGLTFESMADTDPRQSTIFEATGEKEEE